MQLTNTALTYETYLALAVHDLKTPINAQILAANFLLQSQKLPDDMQELINNILGSAKYLKNIVDNILTKYKIDTDNQNFNIQENSINSLLNESIEGIKYLLEEKNVELIVKNSTNIDILKFDFIEIKRVLNNLLSNAIDFTRKKVILKISETKDNIRFSVADYGRGIPLENPKDVFNKDLILANSQKRLGNGLGLFISKQIVLAHKGSITVKTKNDYGTTISFILPK